MSLNCKNVQDYVTLYKDGVLSDETTGEINGHLAGCRECKLFYKEYDGMNTSIPEPEEIINDDADYAAVARKIRKTKLTNSVLTIAGMVAAVAGAIYLSRLLFSDDK